jgi:hypothetical protein
MSSGQRNISLGFDDQPYPAGTHMCFIFNDEAERRKVMSAYVQSGLDGGEQVGYYVDTMSPEDLKDVLRDLGVKLPEELDDKQYRFGRTESIYCPDGTFKTERMLDTLAQAHHRSIAEAYVGARITGEMTWALKGYPGSEDLIEYESRINILVRDVPTTAICQYDARCFDGATLYGVLSVHPMMIVHGQVVRNPYYVEPEEYLSRGG